MLSWNISVNFDNDFDASNFANFFKNFKNFCMSENVMNSSSLK